MRKILLHRKPTYISRNIHSVVDAAERAKLLTDTFNPPAVDTVYRSSPRESPRHIRKLRTSQFKSAETTTNPPIIHREQNPFLPEPANNPTITEPPPNPTQPIKKNPYQTKTLCYIALSHPPTTLPLLLIPPLPPPKPLSPAKQNRPFASHPDHINPSHLINPPIVKYERVRVYEPLRGVGTTETLI